MRSVELSGPDWERLYRSPRVTAAEPAKPKSRQTAPVRKVQETISLPREYAKLLRAVAEVRTHVSNGKYSRRVGRPSLGAVVAELVKANLEQLTVEAGAYLARQRESFEILRQRELAKPARYEAIRRRWAAEDAGETEIHSATAA